MRVISLFFTIIILTCNYTSAHLYISPSVSLATQALEEAQFDLSDNSLVLLEEKLEREKLTCAPLSLEEIIYFVKESFASYIDFYPDDEIPFDQALEDIRILLQYSTLVECSIDNKSENQKVAITQVYDGPIFVLSLVKMMETHY